MLHQIFRCKQRIIRPQESEKLSSLLFPALVVDFFLLFEISTVGRFIATELESIDSPSCFADRVQPPLCKTQNTLGTPRNTPEHPGTPRNTPGTPRNIPGTPLEHPRNTPGTSHNTPEHPRNRQEYPQNTKIVVSDQTLTN